MNEVAGDFLGVVLAPVKDAMLSMGYSIMTKLPCFAFPKKLFNDINGLPPFLGVKCVGGGDRSLYISVYEYIGDKYIDPLFVYDD